MKVIEHIQNNHQVAFSFEILPPIKGSSINQLFNIIERIKAYAPSWINVTAHASSLIYQEAPDGSLKRQVYKRRHGTLGICGVIKHKFNLDTVAHLLCQGFSKEETENALIELSYLGVENVFALKGDDLNYCKETKFKSVNSYACDVVKQVNDLRQGRLLDGSAASTVDFCIGVAGYPEKHIEAANLEQDIKYLKQKVAAGAEYIITQMFFDNSKFLHFTEMCRAQGITVPIIPGLKLVKSLKQISSLPKMFHLDLPAALVDELTKYPGQELAIGKEWMLNQIRELIKLGHKNIHFFVMSDIVSILEVLDQL